MHDLLTVKRTITECGEGGVSEKRGTIVFRVPTITDRASATFSKFSVSRVKRKVGQTKLEPPISAVNFFF